jgi:uncharacterized surface protein with fasciclin (FAS1) repeats
MKSMKQIFLAVMLVALLATQQVRATDDLTIAEIVIQTSGGMDKMDNNPHDYDILLKAVVTANLAGALSDAKAKLTVFAPNDNAFYRLAMDLGYKKDYNEMNIFNFLVEALGTLGDAVEVLTNVLLYHVADGVFEIHGIRQIAKSRRSITTLLKGVTIAPKTSGRSIFLQDKDPDFSNPKVIRPNSIKAKNGIIHTINRVLIPINI